MPSTTTGGQLSSTSRRGKVHDAKSNTTAIDPLNGATEVLPNRLYYNTFKTDPRASNSDFPSHALVPAESTNKGGGGRSVIRKRIHYFNVDKELVYWNFFLDFGPLNLGQLYRFCQKLNTKLEDPRLSSKLICFYSNATYNKRANAIYLICAWQVLYMGRTPEEACSSFYNVILPDYDEESRQHGRSGDDRSTLSKNKFGPIPPFHDASPCECTYNLTILDCLKGLAKAQMYKFFNFDNFPIEEFEHFEQVENGDLTWIMQDKMIAFAGPQKERNVTSEGCYTLTPADFIPYFQKKNVGLVIRLNKRLYDENDFHKAGINHVDHYYLDGSCPTMSILQNVIKDMEAVPSNKGIAVHCKAGLGRTGTCIGAYIMKHYKFTAAEVIGWMRVCRPGMVIGPQQHFMEDLEERMWYEGDVMRSKPGDSRALRSNNHKRGKDGEEMPGIEALSMHDQMRYKHGHDAVIGRAGQADGLLSRRGR